jgi:C-methyltransferase
VAELALEDLQDLLWTFAQHRVLTVAGRVGVIRRLAESAATPEQVAGELGLEPGATAKLVRSLHALGLLTAEDHSYRVVDGLVPHFQGGNEDLTAFLEHSHDMYEGWGRYLESWLRGEPWPSKAGDPDGARRFGAAMRAIGSEIASKAARHLAEFGASTVLDVGGGFGQYSIALCREIPELSATVIDRPAVIELARSELEGTPFEERVSFVPGDYLSTDYGTGFDLVLIANVLHQEPPAGAADLIRRAAAAAVPTGRVAVVDFSIDDHQRRDVLGTLFAINMRSFGDTYTEPVIRQWMADAGLVDVSRIDLSRHKWLISGRTPG